MNILKKYSIGAAIIYPLMLILVVVNAWTPTVLPFVIMKIYGILVLPVLGIHFYSSSKKLLAYVFYVLFAFAVVYCILFPNIIF